MRPPRVRTHSFPPSIRRIYTSGPCSCRASSCFADLPTFVCLMRFLFVGSVVCRRLPSAHVSRRRPCLWLCAWRYLLHSGLAPIRTRSCRAHKKTPLNSDNPRRFSEFIRKRLRTQRATLRLFLSRDPSWFPRSARRRFHQTAATPPYRTRRNPCNDTSRRAD